MYMITLGLIITQMGDVPWWLWAAYGIELVYSLVKMVLREGES